MNNLFKVCDDVIGRFVSFVFHNNAAVMANARQRFLNEKSTSNGEYKKKTKIYDSNRFAIALTAYYRQT